MSLYYAIITRFDWVYSASATASAAKSGPSPAIKAQEASKQLSAEVPAAPQADADVEAEDDCEGLSLVPSKRHSPDFGV